MESLNRIELIGKVGNSNITRIADTEVLRMSVATTYGYESTDGNKIYETTWHNVTAWKGEKVTAETIYGIEKGTDVRVFVSLIRMGTIGLPTRFSQTK